MISVFMYTADYCLSCKMLKPILQEVCDKYKIEFVQVDVVAFPEEAAELKIYSLPTIIFCNNGAEYHRHIGTMTRYDIEKALREPV